MFLIEIVRNINGYKQHVGRGNTGWDLSFYSIYVSNLGKIVFLVKKKLKFLLKLCLKPREIFHADEIFSQIWFLESNFSKISAELDFHQSSLIYFEFFCFIFHQLKIIACSIS